MPRLHCTTRIGLVATLAAVTAGAALAAPALQKPGRTLVRPARITQIGLTHATVVFSVAGTKADCDHVEMWNTDTKGTWRFGKASPIPCNEGASTGQGIWSVAATSRRALWLSYIGGNLRDWQLYTATPTKKTPRRLRFVERDVDAAPPIVIGPGSEAYVPYAVDAQVTLLRDNGSAAFTWTAPANVRALTTGAGPGGARVAALLETGEIVTLSDTGAVLATLPYAPGAVRAIALAPSGVLAQLQGAVEITKGPSKKTVTLPAGASLLDYAEGRILYRLGVGIHALRVSDAQDTLLLQGTKKTPVLAAYDTRGLAWAAGTRVDWACAGCVVYGP